MAVLDELNIINDPQDNTIKQHIEPIEQNIKPKKKYKSKFDNWTEQEIREYKLEQKRKRNQRYYQKKAEQIRTFYKNKYTPVPVEQRKRKLIADARPEDRPEDRPKDHPIDRSMNKGGRPRKYN